MSTKIEWCEETWNPVTGCTAVSVGCENCYARRRAKMLAKNSRIAHPERYEGFKVSLHPDRLNQPLHWRKPRRVFVCSMGDLFHQTVPTDFICDVWFQCWRSKQHQFLILTKRPRRMWTLVNTLQTVVPNLWLGVSVENQETADERIPILLQIPAAVRFVSVEPMLGPVDLLRSETSKRFVDDDWDGKITYLERLDWVICGAETGPGARRMHPDWARDLCNQCIQADVPFFYKSGSNGNRQLDGQLWEQYPERSEL